MKHYRAIPDSEEEVKIEVDYSLGGLSYFTGKTHERGIYVHFMRVIRTVTPGGLKSERFEPFRADTFKVLAKELKRKSPKQQGIIDAYVARHVDELAREYLAGNYGRVVEIVRSFGG